jgi:NTE family protein
MERKRIAIACQGGGSQCAFVAGALKGLFARGVHDRVDIVGLSGTSGGAFTAALAWMGLLEQGAGDHVDIGGRILDCWRDLSAQTPQEMMLDGVCVGLLRLAERGWIPSVAMSPSSLQFQLWSHLVARQIGRPSFTDLRALLQKHLPLEALPRLLGSESPVLLVGAGDVLDGTIRVFSSARREINLDALLASAAIPNLFPAAWVDGHAYWDGIFASNPPIVGFLQRSLMGTTRRPNEIWILQVNRARHETVPETPSDISDRRNNLAGNLSLQHELQIIELVNVLLQQGSLTDEVRAHFSFDVAEPITVRFLRMSQEEQERLDYPSKLSRQPRHIEKLLADGERQADVFLDELGGFERAAAAPVVVEGVDDAKSPPASFH